jgi:hypothetical protein
MYQFYFFVKFKRLFFFKDYFFLKMNEMSLGMFPESGGSSLSSLKIVKTKLKLNYSAFNHFGLPLPSFFKKSKLYCFINFPAHKDIQQNES